MKFSSIDKCTGNTWGFYRQYVRSKFPKAQYVLRYASYWGNPSWLITEDGSHVGMPFGKGRRHEHSAWKSAYQHLKSLEEEEIA